jgi:hypothetical protein
MPTELMPHSVDEGFARYAELSTAYPQDPRLRSLTAMMLAGNGHADEAELELETGLKSPLLHAPGLPADLEQRLRIMLIDLQISQQEIEAAKRSAGPLCPGLATLDATTRKTLGQLSACGTR